MVLLGIGFLIDSFFFFCTSEMPLYCLLASVFPDENVAINCIIVPICNKSFLLPLARFLLCLWLSLVSLNLEIWTLYFQIFSPPLSLFSSWDSPYAYVNTLDGIPLLSEALFMFFFIPFFLLFFRLINLYWSIFKFVDIFFHKLKYAVEPLQWIFHFSCCMFQF